MCKSFGGDPGYGAEMAVSALHFPGVWAGTRIQSSGVSYDFWVDGAAHFPTGIVQTSDERVKANSQRVQDARSKVAMMAAFQFERTDLKHYDGTPVVQVGLMAADAEKAVPCAVMTTSVNMHAEPARDDNGNVLEEQPPAIVDDRPPLKGVDYSQIVALLVDDNNALAARIAALEAASAPAN